MIDLEQSLGTKVKFVGPMTMTYAGDYGLSLGDVGIIDYIDPEDEYMTYRVKFPHRDNGLWVSNNRLDVLTPSVDDDEPCGWKVRALKAEAEIKELKQALKTLSEG